MRGSKTESSKKPLGGIELEDAISSIQKSYGAGSIMRLGDEPPPVVNGISTGSLGLDLATGNLIPGPGQGQAGLGGTGPNYVYILIYIYTYLRPVP